MVIGTPFLQIHSSKMICAINELSRFGIGIATGHLVNVSMNVNIHMFPFAVSINGPTMSMATVSLANVGKMVSVMPFRMGLGVFLFLHAEQLCTHLLTS